MMDTATSFRWLSSSQRNLTMPRSGRLAEGGRADAGGLVEIGVAHEPHHPAAGVPAGGDEPAVRGLLRRLRIDVIALRVPLAREGDHLLLAQRTRTVFEDAPDGEILPVVTKSFHSRSSNEVAAKPSTRPQNGAPMLKIGTSATVTRKQTSAPRLCRPAKEAVKALCRMRSMASPASVAMKAGGVASKSRVKNGAIRPKAAAKRQKNSAAVYWRSRSPLAARIAFTGPVRQVGTAPKSPVTIEPAPHAAVMALTGAAWPLALKTAIPWPFCTTSTVMASGTTSSIIARAENCGT